MTPASQADELVLLERLKARDEGAFLELVNRHHGGLLRVALGIVKTRASAEEVVQETWSAFLEAVDTFEQRASLKTFLYRILMNQARTRAHKDLRSSPLSELEGEGEELLADRFGTTGHWASPPTAWRTNSAEVLLERKETLAAISAALEQLPERQRAIIQLRDVDGLTAAEVCELMQLTEVHQRVLLHRARTKLRALIDSAEQSC